MCKIITSQAAIHI